MACGVLLCMWGAWSSTAEGSDGLFSNHDEPFRVLLVFPVTSVPRLRQLQHMVEESPCWENHRALPLVPVRWEQWVTKVSGTSRSSKRR
ncbi:hypothetical protein QBC35DRAFT_494774 [Podospora australis]|uniref:Secreted protein n=1 Tax=Podospora australis TaxID=1536484 RepID=A0AAN6WWS1_9PEZI|nr:hypothetical protein QBC35DRAFT_494774 [Podospora australis]